MIMLALQFFVLPSSAQVSVFPTEAVAGVGGDAAFTCISLSSQMARVEWLINGTSLNDSRHSDVATLNLGTTLRFSNVSAECNHTRIQCRADSVLSNQPATLLVQGSLSVVGSLMVDAGVDHIYVNWTAPFTLDITLTLVDITYCVDVVSSTSSATLHSECGINVTEFTYPLPPRSWCHEYNITVTPVNTAGNGSKSSMPYSQTILGPHLMEVNIGNTSISLFMSALVCQTELTAVDLNAKHTFTLKDSDLTIAETNISFPLDLLMLNRQYRLTVLASNIGGLNMSKEEISTHDITNCTTSNDSNSITISVDFTEHSEATGALLNFIFIHENGVIDFSKSICLAADKTNVSQGLTLPVDMWYPGQYMMYVYDIESDKMIMDGVQYQASNGSLTVMNGQAKNIPPTSVTNCSVDSYAGVITVACSFLFQVTAQRNTLDSVNILHVDTSMDHHTPVTLQVKNGEYLVTILPVQDGSGIMSSRMQTQIVHVFDAETTLSPVDTISTIISNDDVTGLVAGTVVGLALVCLAAVLVIVIVLILKTMNCKKAFKKSENVYVEAQIRGRSDSITVRMSRSSPPTTTASQDAEPAYAMVHDVDLDVHSYSPAAVEVQQDSVQPEESQPQSLTAHDEVPTYSVVNKPHRMIPPSSHTESSHPPPSYNSVVPSDQETSAIPVYTNVNLSLKKLVPGTAAASSQSESMPQSEETDSSSSEPTSATPLLKSNKSLAASHPTLERQSDHSAGDHYVALDHPKMAASSDVINVHHTSSQYAIPAGYKNEQNQTYVFVDLKEGRDKQHELEVTNDIETVDYAELAPQTQVPLEPQSAKEEDSQGIDGERMMDTEPLLGQRHSNFRHNFRSFPWIF